VSLLVLALLQGCWKPLSDEAALDFSALPYQADGLVATDAIVSAHETSLACPDGEAARFFLAWKESAPTPAPLAVVLHSGAFDFVYEPDPAAPLDGDHYQGSSRLTRTWSSSKAWETFGLTAQPVDPSEQNSGALVAALVDQGALVMVPGNCWGDLWRNEEAVQDGDYQTDGFDRNGRAMAWWMIRLIGDGGFASNQDFAPPIQANIAQLYLLGLGDGGRGVAELMRQPQLPAVAGVLVDGSPDRAQAFLDDPQWADEAEGLARIYPGEALDDVDGTSIAALAEEGELPERTAFIWSDGDPRLPQEAIEPTAALLEDLGIGWVHNTRAARHVATNSDPALAAQAVSYLFTGAVP
jgi:hypothetical protein